MRWLSWFLVPMALVVCTGCEQLAPKPAHHRKSSLTYRCTSLSSSKGVAKVSAAIREELQAHKATEKLSGKADLIITVSDEKNQSASGWSINARAVCTLYGQKAFEDVYGEAAGVARADLAIHRVLESN